MRRWGKTISILAVIAIAATGLTMFGCSGDSDDSDPVESQVVEVTRGSLMTTISSFGSISLPEQAELTFGGESTSDLHTVSEINVEFGDMVKEGDILARLDTASLERAVTQAESDLRTAEIDLEEAVSETNLLKAQASVESAEYSLAKAEGELEDTLNSSTDDAVTDLENAQRSMSTAQLETELDIAKAEKEFETARDAWGDFVQENIDLLTTINNSIREQELLDDIEEAEKNLQIVSENAATSIAKAEMALATAEDALLNAPLEIQQKQVNVATAKANLSQAQDDLAYVEAGHDIELLQIKVDNAQDALDEALEQLDAATIVAPFDGVVAEVSAVVGDEVKASDVIIHLVNTSVVEVDAAVDEIDVGSVEEGQVAIVTLDAIADARLRGSVTAVSPIATSSSGVVTYEIAVEVQGTDEYDLKEGMSATITIMALDVQDVLLVASNAVQQTVDGYVVQVVGDDGITEKRAVEIGATNGQQTEIINGLVEGEKVEVQMSADMSATMEQSQQGVRIPGMDSGGMSGMRGR